MSKSCAFCRQRQPQILPLKPSPFQAVSPSIGLFESQSESVCQSSETFRMLFPHQFNAKLQLTAFVRCFVAFLVTFFLPPTPPLALGPRFPHFLLSPFISIRQTSFHSKATEECSGPTPHPKKRHQSTRHPEPDAIFETRRLVFPIALLL